MTTNVEITHKLEEIKDSVETLDKNVKMLDSNLLTLDQKLDKHISVVHRAFPRNDLEEPDFDGHRVYHIDRRTEKRRIDDYKQSITVKILQGVAGFVLMLVGLGIASWVKTG